MFVAQQDGVDLKEEVLVNNELLKSGATIQEMNIIRKHLSKVKGGGLAKAIYPAKIAGLIFSDVPGNDMSIIASGPITKDISTIEEAKTIIKKYNIDAKFDCFKCHGRQSKIFRNNT
jgi:glycerate-2-kinase